MTLERFIDAQTNAYDQAVQEIRGGYKYGHWIWYIIPMLYGVKRSSFCDIYGLQGLAEATDYYQHPLLGERLTVVAEAVVTALSAGHTLEGIFGNVDAKKTISCMTLFQIVGADPGVQECPHHQRFQTAAQTILAAGDDQGLPRCVKTLTLLGM
jgi:uncharacterized protein (DUF1810 family)